MHFTVELVAHGLHDLEWEAKRWDSRESHCQQSFLIFLCFGLNLVVVFFTFIKRLCIVKVIH